MVALGASQSRGQGCVPEKPAIAIVDESAGILPRTKPRRCRGAPSMGIEKVSSGDRCSMHSTCILASVVAMRRKTLVVPAAALPCQDFHVKPDCGSEFREYCRNKDHRLWSRPTIGNRLFPRNRRHAVCKPEPSGKCPWSWQAWRQRC